MTTQPDIRLTVRAKNARLLGAMEAAGFPTLAALARAIGATNSHYSDLCALVGFKAKPIDKHGGWRDVALDVASVLGKEPDELWPEYLREIEMKRTEVTLDVSIDEFASLASGESKLIDHATVSRLLKHLNSRDRAIIEMRYGLNGLGEHTCVEVGGILGLEKTTVSAAEHRALGVLRKLMPRAESSEQVLEEE